jgi:hypothetical protein
MPFSVIIIVAAIVPVIIVSALNFNAHFIFRGRRPVLNDNFMRPVFGFHANFRSMGL